MKRTAAIVFMLIFAMLFSLVSCDDADKKQKTEFIFMVDGKEYAKSGDGITANPTKEGYVFDGWYLDDGTWQQPYNFLFSSVVQSGVASGDNYYFGVGGDFSIVDGSSENIIVVSPRGGSVVNGSYVIGSESDVKNFYVVSGGAYNPSYTTDGGSVYVYAKFITEAEAAERKEKEDQKEKDSKENNKDKNEDPSDK